MILHITPHCRSHSGSSIISGLPWNSLHITAWTTSPVVGNIPAGSVPALQVVNTVQRSLFMSITSHHEFFSLRSPLIIRLPLMKEPWRCLSLSWILAIVNNQYCYLLPPHSWRMSNYELWSLLKKKSNSTRLGHSSVAREKEMFITMFLRPVPCSLSIWVQ